MNSFAIGGFIGTALAVLALGGFMAADRLVLHWYVPAENEAAIEAPIVPATPGLVASPTPIQPNFSELDVLNLVQSRLAGRPFPSGTSVLLCLKAEFQSGNRLWLVRCGYYSTEPGFFGTTLEPDRLADHFVSVLLDDDTGQLVP